MSELPTDTGLLGVIAGGATAIAIIIRQFTSSLRSERVDSLSSDAHIQVVEMLRKEVERLSDSNRQLAERNSEMIKEVMELRKEIISLKTALEECKSGWND